MADIATTWNAAAQRGDWSIANGDLTTESGLATAIYISLGTWHRADSSDAAPSEDPGGWWGDIPADGGPADEWGCKFWLRRRAKLGRDIANTLIADARQALQWLIDDGVAASLDITAFQQSPPLGTVLLNITVNRAAGGVQAFPQFAAAWEVTMQ